MSITKLTEKDELLSMNSSKEGRNILPKQSIEIAGVIATSDKKTVNKIKKITGELLKNSMNFEDSECELNFKNFFEAHKKSERINTSISKKNYKKESEMVNKASSWMQETASVAEYYYMEDMIGPFYKSFRSFCNILNKYNKNLKTSKDSRDLNIHFRTLEFSFKKLEEEYKTTKLLFKERTDEEPISFMSQIWSGKWSFLKWIWKYKYCLYITGTLLYNGSVYVGLPFGGFFNVMIQIVGTVCYTFASDKVIMGKLLNLILYIISQTVWGIYSCMPQPEIFSKIGKNIPKWVKSAYSGCTAAVFYTFLWFSLDWVSKLVKMICQGIIVFGAGYRAGTESISGIWTIFEESAVSIKGDFNNAIILVSKLMENAGTSISDGISLIFVDVMFKGTVVPIISFVKHLPRNAWDTIKNMVLDGKKTTDGTQVVISKEQEEQLRALSIITKDGGKQIGELLKKHGIEIHEVVRYNIKNVFENSKKIAKASMDKSYEEVSNKLESVMKKQGTYKLYKGTHSLDIGLYTTKQTIMIYIVFAMISAIFSFT
jgi:hypothetical protein